MPDAASLRRPVPVANLGIATSIPLPQIRRERREQSGGRAPMSTAYVIEVYDRTAGIVTRDERGFSFFSSERAFDSLEGVHFSSARDVERAARALVSGSHETARHKLL
jgi:hypothetical protein